MQEINIANILLQIIFSFTFCLFFSFLGYYITSYFYFFKDEAEDDYQEKFFSIFSGIILIVILYSIVVAGFKTVNIFLVIASIIFLKKKKAVYLVKFPSNFKRLKFFVELLGTVAFFVLVFNLMPESEYKQKDSFYYLKISESLSGTGQENASHYYNFKDNAFHGVEAYHYFEFWLNALLIRFTRYWLPNIQTLRIICYSVLSVTFLQGLFYIYGLIAKSKITFSGKIVCVAFLFFLPDLYDLFPYIIRKYLIFNFENNYLERPNFRIIYLFALPVTGALLKQDAKVFMLYLLWFIFIHPSLVIPMIPVMVFFYLAGIKQSSMKLQILRPKDFYFFILLLMAYGAFYILFSVKGLPAMYETTVNEIIEFYKRSYKYVLLTIMTSLIYIAVIGFAAWLLFRYVVSKEDRHLDENISATIRFLLLFSCCGIILARILDFKENLYQVAYNGYIFISLFIFILFVRISRLGLKWTFFICVLFTAGYIGMKYRMMPYAFLNIFRQNGKECYKGLQYSEVYINSVIEQVKGSEKSEGAFIADSGYYKNLYYSNRNPNVYHLPITYIIADKVETNVDYCLSSPEAILYTGSGSLDNNAYLENAISRSYYHYLPGDRTGEFVTDTNKVKQFIRNNRIKYIILTKGIDWDIHIPEASTVKITDKNTGERTYFFSWSVRKK